MDTICRWITVAFAVLYLGALCLLAIGALGLFGVERDPLAGAFLNPLGLYWNSRLDGAGRASAPLLDLVLIDAVCRLASRLRR